jgi:hypothetical protein
MPLMKMQDEMSVKAGRIRTMRRGDPNEERRKDGKS